MPEITALTQRSYWFLLQSTTLNMKKSNGFIVRMMNHCYPLMLLLRQYLLNGASSMMKIFHSEDSQHASLISIRCDRTAIRTLTLGIAPDNTGITLILRMKIVNVYNSL